MDRCSTWQERILPLLVLLGLPLLLACRVPTAMPLPTPDERAIYAMMTEKYTSWGIIFSVQDMSADESARILQALQAIQPPQGLEALHEQALDAYRHICKGKLLLPGADSLVRAEAYFMIDWGIGRLLEYREQLGAYCR